MSNTITFRGLSVDALPPALAQALTWQPPGAGKRERTRRQLLLAALQVFSARGVARSTIQEIALTAGMTTGTVYNHFETKEAVVQAVGGWFAETLCQRINDSQASVPEGAERMAIGQRRFIDLAEHCPAWALLIIEVASAAPQQLGAQIAKFAGADLRLGMAQGAFKVDDEAAALDMIIGVPMQAMRSVALGLASPDHGVQVTAMLLRGLGLSASKAAQVAARPLPPLIAPGDRVETRFPAVSKRRQTTSAAASPDAVVPTKSKESGLRAVKTGAARTHAVMSARTRREP